MRRFRGIFSLFVLLSTLATAPASAQRQHRVRSGDSLSRIARRYHVDLWDLALANETRPDRTLQPGSSLDIPPSGICYVRPGHTLATIAREHDCTVDVIRRLNHLRPGSGLRVGQRLVLPGYQEQGQAESEESTDEERNWGVPRASGVSQIQRNGQVITVRLVDAENRVTREGLERLGNLMRRRENDPIELPHPRLVRLLAAISDHFGGRELVLVSGRRDAVGFTQETSRHVSGHATDIRVDGIPRRALWDFCRSLNATGCGYYPRSTFVHVDVRDRAGQWVDWSRPGRRPQYGNLSGPWRPACMRRGARPEGRCSREGRRITRPDLVPIDVELTSRARALMPVTPAVSLAETEREDAT